MSYLETYFITGFLFTMLFEFIFETILDGELKFSSFGERLIFFFFWPLIFLIVMKEMLKNIDVF
jgi:hypothetical protein